jgi:hypothetical protein
MLDYPRSLLRLSSSHVAVLLSLSAALAACSSDTKAGGGSDASAGGATGTGGSASGGKGGSASGTGGSASGAGGSASGTGGATGTGGSAASTGGTTGTTGTDGGASGGSSGTCAFGGACGGALVGTWDITDICPPKVPEAIGICPTDPDSTLTLLGGTGVLTVTGASYTLDITATLNAVYSAACLAPTQMKVCTDVEVQLVKSFGGTAVCTGSRTTSCDCIMHMPQKTDTGTIVIAGNTVKLVNQGSTEAATIAQNFCVKGTALELEKTATTTSDAGAAKTSTTVFKATKK